MDLGQYLSIVRKFWVVILLSTCIGLLAGVYVTSTAEVAYRGSVTFFVRTSTGSTANNQFAADQFAQRRVNSYVALLTTDRLANMILKNTNVKLSAKQVSGMISATGDINTVLLTATVTTDSKQMAEVLTSALATQFVELVNSVENEGGEGAVVNLEVVSGPNVTKVRHSRAPILALTGLLGLAVGVVTALILELRDTSIQRESELYELKASPVLGRIPSFLGTDQRSLVMRTSPSSHAAEAIRELRTNLQFMSVERPLKVIAVTSSLPGEGKSTLAANLAIAMAASQNRVLLIEADFRRPSMADFFDTRGLMGLSDVLASQSSLETSVEFVGIEGLMVLPCGRRPPNPSELLGSEKMREVLVDCSAMVDLIIIDTPPLIAVTDGAIVAGVSDGVLLVVEHGRTTRHQVESSVRALEAVRARLIGSVLNKTPEKSRSGYEVYENPPATGADKTREPLREPNK
jgi:capsular exopolysaccharide synthesis family protein